MQYMFWLGREGEMASGGYVPKGKMYLVGSDSQSWQFMPLQQQAIAECVADRMRRLQNNQTVY